MSSRSPAARAVAVEERLRREEALLASASARVLLFPEGSAGRAEAAAATAKIQRRLDGLLRELSAAAAVSTEQEREAARQSRANARARQPLPPPLLQPARSARRKRMTASAPAVSKVTATRTAPVDSAGEPVCKRCGIWGPLHTAEGLCGKCLRAAGQVQCDRCGGWRGATAKSHSCGEPAGTSVRTAGGGLPGLGSRR
jgi:hypothetical protein